MLKRILPLLFIVSFVKAELPADLKQYSLLIASFSDSGRVDLERFLIRDGYEVKAVFLSSYSYRKNRLLSLNLKKIETLSSSDSTIEIKADGESHYLDLNKIVKNVKQHLDVSIKDLSDTEDKWKTLVKVQLSDELSYCFYFPRKIKGACGVLVHNDSFLNKLEGEFTGEEALENGLLAGDIMDEIFELPEIKQKEKPKVVLFIGGIGMSLLMKYIALKSYISKLWHRRAYLFRTSSL